MSERPFDWRRDGFALGLFALFTFFAVLMVQALRATQPLGEVTGSAAFADPWVRSLGALPSLVLCAGLAFLGARMYVLGREGGLWRHALGLVGVALGLSIVCGAFTHTGGGRIGALSGGVIAEHTHAALGALLGMGVLLSSAWFVWLRDGPALGAGGEVLRPMEQAVGIDDDGGVTPAEAAALVPDEQVLALARRQLAARPIAHPIAPLNSPYPEDVRLKGQIPPGAKPLGAPQAAQSAPSMQDAPLVQPIETPESRWGGDAELLAEPELETLAPIDEPLLDDLEDADVLDPLEGERAPSWERTGLTSEDEPVDAYGTPRSLIDSLRKSNQETLAGIAELPPAPVIPESPANAAIPAIPAVASVTRWEPRPTSPTWEAEPEPALALSAAIIEPEPTPELAAELEADDELDSEIAELEDEVGETVELDEDEADEEFDDDDDDLDDLDDEFVAEDDEELVSELDEEENALPAEVDVYSADREEPEPASSKPLVAQSSLFDEATEPARATRAPLAQTLPAPEPEREVELTPQAPPAGGAIKSLAVDPSRAKLLGEAGCLFVDNGRVAVSMLQRQYKMEFDDACKVLDELQALGLIGPYLGGKHRDILLTRDQWLEKVESL